MIDKSMKEKALPAELIITDFVKNEKHCNYEEYLLEFVNKSSFYLQKSGGEQYNAPISESNGECDCNSKAYKLDFKLIAGQSLLKAKSTLSAGKTLLAPGIVATTNPKKGNDI